MASTNNSSNVVASGSSVAGSAKGKSQSTASNFDHYIKESTRSFKECHIKNSARRNSLQKKTQGIERERKISSSQLDKKEKILRQKYHQLQEDQKFCSSSHCLENAEEDVAKEESRLKMAKEKKAQEMRIQQGRGEDDVVINPYPITFRPKTGNSHKKQSSKTQTDSPGLFPCRRRRMSSEFEDLVVNTKTGNLQLPVPRNRKLALTPMFHPSKVSQVPRPSGVMIKEEGSIRRIRKWSDQE